MVVGITGPGAFGRAGLAMTGAMARDRHGPKAGSERADGAEDKATLGKGASEKSGAEKDASKEALLELLKKAEADRLEDWRRKAEETKNLVTQLRERRVDYQEQRKAAAREKVARIKAELRALRLMAHINPEAAARRAAQLSKELSAAVKAYSSGGGGAVGQALAAGGAAGGATTDGGQAGAQASATAGVSAEGAALSADAAVQANGMGDVALGGASVAAAPTDASTASGSAQAAPQTASEASVGLDAATGSDVAAGADATGDSGATSSGSPGTTSSGTGETGAEQGTGEPASAGEAEKTDGQATAVPARAGQASSAAADKAKEDQEFAREVTRVKEMLKAVLQAAKRALEAKARDGEDTTDALRDVASGERALKDTETALSNLTAGGGIAQGMAGAVSGGSVGVSILV